MTSHAQLPATMDALVWTAPSQMEMQQTPLPVPADNEVLLEVAAVGICGSELSGYLGHNSLRVPPLIMGHEFSARVVRVGGGAFADGAAPVLGQRVVVNPLISCGECGLCAAGLPNLCPQRRIVGAHRAGGFARYVAVPTAQCWPLSAGMSDVAGALVEPLACAVRAVQHAQWQGTAPLLILGAGAIGLCCLAVARAESPGAIVISDMVDARLQLAHAWGATITVNGRSSDAQQQLRAALPDGAISVIDAVGSNATRALALQLVRPGGRVIYIGLHDEASSLAANYLVRQEVAIQGSFAYTPADFARAIDTLAAGIVAPSPAWVEERPLSAGGASFAGLVDGSLTIPKVMLRPQ
jgi:threonine dehydrogenase-like Zn-dependent dehydrogenase